MPGKFWERTGAGNIEGSVEARGGMATTPTDLVLAGQLDEDIDRMLDNAIEACPEALWEERLYLEKDAPRYAVFWYLAYHTLFWLDVQIHGTLDGAPSSSWSRLALRARSWSWLLCTASRSA